MPCFRDDQAERVRARGYVVATVPAYLDDDFRGHFRMTRHQVQQLQEDLGAAGAYAEDHGGREPISPGKAPLVLLWTLANQDTIRSISDRFDLTKSSVIRSNRRLTNAIVNDLLGEHVKWPNNTAAGAIDCVGGIEIVGAIDGSHIPISQPVEDQEVYVNRKGFHSLVLQAVCQADMRFIDVFTGYPGSVHDARVFRNSPLCQALPRLCPDGESVILGDSAYPLTGQLITPFKDNGRLTRRQKRFNTEVSKRRVVIERAFALLKGRFRRLKFLKMWSIADTTKTIIAACVLHNMCLAGGDRGDDFGELTDGAEGLEVVVPRHRDDAAEDRRDERGAPVREQLMTAFLGPELR
ncbi:putative nuclease HARBI1 [Amphibalanus amphitrite]|uniref:putative nuclease HARBI1 n=1 Tax=Amphibalanus amphitrite TaxID=1232801 RepID=UPI001C91D82E|nr:putative nuclease HARBI1 [Amphibalanus amphitrite]